MSFGSPRDREVTLFQAAGPVSMAGTAGRGGETQAQGMLCSTVKVRRGLQYISISTNLLSLKYGTHVNQRTESVSWKFQSS